MKARDRELFLPRAARVEKKIQLTQDVTVLEVGTREQYNYRPGQFFMLSLFGVGEVPISVTSAREEGEQLAFCIRSAGRVTRALTELEPGDELGVRGPYGNGFPLEPAEGRDVLFLAGGLGIAPLRPLILKCLNERERFGSLSLLFGSRDPESIIYYQETDLWGERGLEVILTVDCSLSDWRGCEGMVVHHFDKVSFDLKGAAAYICGPDIMIENGMRDLAALGMPEERIVTTLEAHMKCGVGKCGHCYRGRSLICLDGPVFTWSELKTQWSI